ncbi:MAG: preprotein translocase subunit SecD [Actinomycetota bacterium]|nr:preprotein translocase subunit SecD [Actinomycetota bacterium]
MPLSRYKTYLAVTLLVAFGGLALVIFTKTSPSLGLDLRGGTSVILQAESSETVTSDVLSKTADIIRQRLNNLGVGEVDVSTAGSGNILVQIPAVKDRAKALKLIGTTAQLTFRQVKAIFPPATPKKKLPPVTKDTSSAANDQEVVYPAGSTLNQAGTLYQLDPAVLTGDVVTKAEAVVDPNNGNWSVSISMNDQGSKTWATFTSKLACLRDKNPNDPTSEVAIVLDGKVENAAGMQQSNGGTSGVACNVGITGGNTQINVGDETEAKDLALILKTGALPITLKIQSVQEVSPTLGKDSLNAGLKAGIIGLILVFIYVLLYYRALGLIVWLGLLSFTALMYTVLAVLGRTAGLTLSLAGIAGIIVSIGITSDSYIVAFERLKDEVRSGKSMRAAVDRGMHRAFRTILVADFVTFAAAAILFLLAVGAVKGFALTLGLATLIDVLTAYFFTRSAVVLLARNKRFAGAGFLGMKEALGVEA